MLRTLTTKRWLTWLLVAAIWALACVFLGRWQLHRWQEKSVKQDQISRNYDGPTVPLSSVMSTSRAPAPKDEWKQVKASGRYVGSTYMVRNRPGPSDAFGYEVVNIFETGGVKVVVDRGWVGNGANAGTPESIPAPPKGEITLVGWTRPSEKNLKRPDVPGQISSISVSELQSRTGVDLAEGYLRMRSEKTSAGATPDRPIALSKPDQGQAAGINLSYALQWWAGAIAGFVFVFMRARREHLDALLDAEELTNAEQPTRAGGASGGAVHPDAESRGATAEGSQPVGDPAASPRQSPRPARKQKPKKKRIWDEEDE